MDKVGKVTEREKEEILLIYERKLAIKELEQALDDMSLGGKERQELAAKLEADHKKTCEAYDGWWARVREKYNWESGKNMEWYIHFETNEVFL